jgi:2,4-dienoyl-CoA reductase-like NADH-dependent reductase (Old Yellow Enzyme family)
LKVETNENSHRQSLIVTMNNKNHGALFQPLELPCGTILKNRIAKSAMSDSLGDGCGNPTEAQIRLYERWAGGGVATMIVGEVQGSPDFAEKPGNLVLSVSIGESNVRVDLIPVS